MRSEIIRTAPAAAFPAPVRIPAPQPDHTASADEPPPAPAVVVRDLRRRFGKYEALRGVSVSVPAGSTFGLLGPNGSGKTTLLRTIAGVLRPTDGTLAVLGEPPGRTPSRVIGYMPQGIAMFAKVTVYETIRCFAGLQDAGDGDHIDRALAAVGLLEHKHRIVRELSQGTQRRVSLACTIAHEPRLLLLDEPTAGVDPGLRVAFWEHFRELNRRGVTIIIATHDMDEAGLCDGLAFLREGSLIETGAPEEIRARYGVATMEQAFIRLSRVPA